LKNLRELKLSPEQVTIKLAMTLHVESKIPDSLEFFEIFARFSWVLFFVLLGSVLIYQHDIFHEDSAVLSGRKYVLRTDIMYSAKKVENEKELRRLKKTDKGKFGMFM
jgi:hypothetical protein